MNQKEAEERLRGQIDFITTIDRLKSVRRQNTLIDGSRPENSAEHSWHVAVMAVLLAEHAHERIDVCCVVKMILLHDIVEIEAGDTFVYDDQARATQEAREREAANRLFSILPADQSNALRALWDDFESGSSPEARFAVALDRFQPLLQNFHSGGGTWNRPGVDYERVRARKEAAIERGSPCLWRYAQALLNEAVTKGILR